MHIYRHWYLDQYRAIIRISCLLFRSHQIDRKRTRKSADIKSECFWTGTDWVCGSSTRTESARHVHARTRTEVHNTHNQILIHAPHTHMHTHKHRLETANSCRAPVPDAGCSSVRGKEPLLVFQYVCSTLCLHEFVRKCVCIYMSVPGKIQHSTCPLTHASYPLHLVFFPSFPSCVSRSGRAIATRKEVRDYLFDTAQKTTMDATRHLQHRMTARCIKHLPVLAAPWESLLYNRASVYQR